MKGVDLFNVILVQFCLQAAKSPIMEIKYWQTITFYLVRNSTRDDAMQWKWDSKLKHSLRIEALFCKINCLLLLFWGQCQSRWSSSSFSPLSKYHCISWTRKGIRQAANWHMSSTQECTHTSHIRDPNHFLIYSNVSWEWFKTTNVSGFSQGKSMNLFF